MSSLQLPVLSPAQGFATPVNPYQNYNNFDTGSRSTSAYSTVSASAGPIMPPNSFNVPPPQQQNGGPGHPAVQARDNQYQFRLPSDQLAQIISALNPHKQEQVSQPSQHAMPPPPLPGHVAQYKHENAPIGHYAPLAPRDRTELDQQALNAIDRRAASSSGYSDVSMHAGCENFPHCITEDPSGCLVHNNTVVSAGMVKGKKEGSSPTKRKLSTNSAAKKNERTEKRARNSSRLPQRGSRRTSNKRESRSASAVNYADADDDGADDDASQPGEGEGGPVIVAGVE